MQWNTFMIMFLLNYASAANVSWELLSKHPAWEKLAAIDCGESAADRIIGGENAALGQFPWIARLGYKDLYENELDWKCGGTLLTDSHVVTAAHCVDISPDDEIQLQFIRLGEYNANTNPDCQLGVCAPPVQDRLPKRIKSHPSFNKPRFHNDMAIIELAQPVNLSEYVAPICLPRKQELEDALRIGELVTVAGWGTMNMSTEERADILQFVQLPVVESALCDKFGKGFKVAESEICAGAQHNKDACNGDSGGPLMKVYDTPEGPKNFLVGVVSFGPLNCGIKKPGVYSSVPYFLKWILDNII